MAITWVQIWYRLQAFKTALDSGEYVQIRNALIVLSKIVQVSFTAAREHTRVSVDMRLFRMVVTHARQKCHLKYTLACSWHSIWAWTAGSKKVDLSWYHCS